MGRKCTNNFGQWDAVPAEVEGFTEPIISIACGTEHNLALGESGHVYSWGWNEHDNCGIPTSPPHEVIPYPTKVTLPKTESAILIGCGAGNSFAVTKSAPTVASAST